MQAAVRRFAVMASLIALPMIVAPVASAAVPEVHPMTIYPCYHGTVPSSQYAWARCNGNTGSFRAVAYCHNGVAGQNIVRYGPYRTAPTPEESIVLCSSQEAVYDSTVQASS
ncbi:hypothetical protein [Flindersiella endophytica]